MRRRRLAYLLMGGFAACVYLYGLGGQYIPKIGDEAIYLQIARVTGGSGPLLPLRAELGVNDTKPPLLFWTGIAATDDAKAWTLFRARLPIVLYSVALAGLCWAFAYRVSRDEDAAWVAALSFLCFHSTFQHGRPFLTNMPEAFWLFLPFYLIVEWPDAPAALLGACVGLGLLYKSFVGVAPVAAALAWHRRRALDPFILLVAVVALAVFFLWPAFDPARGHILSQFLIGENLAKLGGGERAVLSGHGYLWNAFFGPYHLLRIWGGPFVNAGLLALPLAALPFAAWRARRGIVPEERLLWIILCVFMVFYSIPSQRQENYLLPAMPAAAVLLGLYWKRISDRWLAASSAPIALVFVAALAFFGVIGRAGMPLPISYGSLPWGAAAAGLLAAGVAVARPAWARRLYHPLVLTAYLTLALTLAPFDGPAGRFDPSALAGRQVYVPTGWDYKPRTEYYRLALPNAQVLGFDDGNAELRSDLLAAGKNVGMVLQLGQDAPAGCETETSRLFLKSRLPPREVLALLSGDIGRLVGREAIVRCGEPSDSAASRRPSGPSPRRS